MAIHIFGSFVYNTPLVLVLTPAFRPDVCYNFFRFGTVLVKNFFFWTLRSGLS
jgi:hypothetical protein